MVVEDERITKEVGFILWGTQVMVQNLIKINSILQYFGLDQNTLNLVVVQDEKITEVSRIHPLGNMNSKTLTAPLTVST